MHDFVGFEQHAKSPLEVPASGTNGMARAAAADEVRFLQGPQPRGFELGNGFEIFCELMRGFRTFHGHTAASPNQAATSATFEPDFLPLRLLHHQVVPVLVFQE